MNRILYFNINYQCNNACRFCFSHNVDTGRPSLSFSDFCKTLEMANAGNTDLIVLNGGEPTLHPQFNKFIEHIKEFSLICNIYSNGTLINNRTYPVAYEMISFIIPIHGNENTHDYIAGRKGAFQDTITSLKYLNTIHSRYSLKFIITNEMVNSDFSIKDFLANYALNPEEIYIARVNATIKSRKNEYKILPLDQTKNYILRAYNELNDSFLIKYLDIPACLLPDCNVLNITVPNLDYYFNDVSIQLQKRDYYKERLETVDCKDCKNSASCDLLSKSYYVIGKAPHGNYTLIAE